MDRGGGAGPSGKARANAIHVAMLGGQGQCEGRWWTPGTRPSDGETAERRRGDCCGDLAGHPSEYIDPMMGAPHLRGRTMSPPPDLTGTDTVITASPA